ncbi:DgyrCDS10890 [Dimorphilus gyrociliatus]|uniref:DgyrCDS10890 n=1 Tax=Dimorphilus gyrociliatus TaxID=2664684 RepID=A0A7I8W483_9ANNE|nr:DgyrCDS10890 [Dimorphilus gyrociliatus]
MNFSTPKHIRRSRRFDLNASASGKNRTLLSTTKDVNNSFSFSFPATPLSTSLKPRQTSSKYKLEPRVSGFPPKVQDFVSGCFLEDPSYLSACIKPEGFTYFAYRERLLIYSINKNNITDKIYEISFPKNSFSVRTSTDLVSILDDGDGAISCFLATPGGEMRYYKDIRRPEEFVDTNMVIPNTVFVNLIGFEDGFYVIASQNGMLYQLQANEREIIYKQLGGGRGMLRGIGRRMSSLLFGAATSTEGAEPLIQMVLGEESSHDLHTFYLLAGRQLQKWCVGGSSQMLYNCDVTAWFKEASARQIWNNAADNLPSLNVCLLDMNYSTDAVVILAACCNEDVSDDVYLLLGSIHTHGNDAPQSFLNVYHCDQKLTIEGAINRNTIRKRLSAPDSQSSAYLIDSKTLLCVPNGKYGRVECETIEFVSEDLIGFGIFDQHTILVDKNRGFVTIKEASQSNNMMKPDLNNSSFYKKDESLPPNMPSVRHLKELSQRSNKIDKLKAAFYFFVSGNRTEAIKLLKDLRQPEEALDGVIKSLAESFIDAAPLSDPRWAEALNQQVEEQQEGRVILVNQLQDKLKVLESFISFLNNSGITETLTTLNTENGPILTIILLQELGEKLMSAFHFASVQQHSSYRAIMEHAIAICVEGRKEALNIPNLRHVDIFYREVSRLDWIFTVLVDIIESKLEVDEVPKMEILTTASSIAGIMEGALQEAIQYRKNKSSLYRYNQISNDEISYFSWLDLEKEQSVIHALERMINLLCRSVLARVETGTESMMIIPKISSLTDILLYAYKSHLNRIPNTSSDSYKMFQRRFAEKRYNILKLFPHGCEQCAIIAEKYGDYRILIEICEKNDDKCRLERYIQQYSNKNFIEFVFKWYSEQEKVGKLLSIPSLAHHPDLQAFLQSEKNKHLGWLQEIKTNSFIKAHKTLHELADAEIDSLPKKKTLLSLSKLAALADFEVCSKRNVEESIERINKNLELILNQETLPSCLIENLGMDRNNMRCLSAEDMIKFCISDLNETACEVDFKKALDLLQYVDPNYVNRDEKIEVLKTSIWARVIKADNWTSFKPDDIINRIRETVFFKTIELSIGQGADPFFLLTKKENLLNSEDLQTMSSDTSFQYALTVAYEYIQTLCEGSINAMQVN